MLAPQCTKLNEECAKISAEVSLRERMEMTSQFLQNLHRKRWYYYPTFSQHEIAISSFPGNPFLNTLSPSFYKIAGEWCSKIIMDQFGYTNDNLQCYLQGAFNVQNKDTIVHLFERAEDKDCLRKEINLLVYPNSEKDGMVPFVSWLLDAGFLQFTEENWSKLKAYPTLYKGLQADV